MRRLIPLILAMFAGSAQAEACLPSVLNVWPLKSIGNMHPAKSPDRPAFVATDPVLGLGLAAVWWCADGSAWEWHGTPSMIANRFGNLRGMQAAYVANPSAVRAEASVKPSCLSYKPSTRSAYCVEQPGRPGYGVCMSNLITDPAEKALCQAVVRQVATDSPK
jgi:hypothetical protein